MPHHPDDQRRYPHQLFQREDIAALRRKQGGGSKVVVGNRDETARKLLEATNRIVQEQQQKLPPPPGINPHLVFRVPLAPKAYVDDIIKLFGRANITVVSVESDRAVIAFRDDNNLTEFQNAIQTYQRGPRPGINPQTGQPYSGTAYDIFSLIDADNMHLWHREDRIGTRLSQEIGLTGNAIELNRLYIIELELWYPGNRQDAQNKVREIRSFIEQRGDDRERFLDSYVGQALALVKVAVLGSTLDVLLDFEIIADADLPPTIQFEPLLAAQMTARDFPSPPRPPENGPRVCILDSGIVSNHPFLRPYIGDEVAVLTRDDSPADINGHGTMVGAIAVFGDIRSCYEARLFSSNITLYSARVLNEHNRFDDEEVIIQQLREAISLFAAPPYSCRVFNLSIGSFSAVSEKPGRLQNKYAEVLDILARELRVLLVVAAGNNQETRASNVDEAETVLTTYPSYLLHASAQINDFATAAIPLTVGALAQFDGRAEPRALVANDIVRLIAHSNEPSPITRSGPGIQGAIKPEFVHYGGSPVFDRSVALPIRSDQGTAIMSFSHQPVERLFNYQVGTSFAAPKVARLAALVDYRLQTEFNIEAHPNLIRALLATASYIPEPASVKLTATGHRHAAIKVCGYGFPDEDLALHSADRRVTLFAQEEIEVDHFHIYGIPIPDSFRYARGNRTITLALAFDPPVAGRRADYLGIEMNMFLLRGMSSQQVFDFFGGIPADDDDDDIENKIPSRNRVTLEPSGRPRTGDYNRKKSTLQCASFTLKRPEGQETNYGDEYWFVVRSERKWAPSEITSQSYAVAVTLQADDPDLYIQVQQRIQQRIRQPIRVRR